MRSRPSVLAPTLALAVAVTGFVGGGGGESTLALLTDSEDSPSTFSTAASFSTDRDAPTIDTSVVAKSSGYVAGFIRQGGSYYVYANVSDTGNPASGVATVKADVSLVSSGQTSVALTSGSYSVEGITYAWRSALLTANNPLSEGSKTYSVSAVDNAGNSRTRSDLAVVVDNTAPRGTDIQTANAGTRGSAEAGDTITYTLSERLEPHSILAGWNGQTANVVVRITNAGGGDVLTVRNSGNSTQLPLGSVNLGGTAYVSANRDFGATGTASSMTMSANTIVVRLGTPSGSTGTQSTAANMTWSPASAATDRAGNACATANVSEQDSVVDVEF